MKSYLIETSVIIDYLRGKEEATALLESLDGNLYSSYICVAELYEGLYRITNRTTQEKTVQTFFNSLDSIYGLDIEIAQKFGELRAFLKQKGNVIEDFDLLLAATCIVYNLELITFNKKHFSHVNELIIYQ